MKIERLIGILSILLQQDKVTAPYLAEKFEVSRRTITRDIEALCLAGIPICTQSGMNGGISIMDGYKVDRLLFTPKELQAIISGLKSLDSISLENRYKILMDKVSAGTMDENNQHIYMNLSSWYKDSLGPKFACIEEAIEHKNLISFDYYAPNKTTKRMIEPYFLVFEWSSWYVFGYCKDRLEYRLFKLNRMEEFIVLEDIFDQREDAFQHMRIDTKNTADRPHFHKIHATIEVKPKSKWRLVEEYGLKSFEETKDHKLRMELEWSDENSFFSWALGFLDDLEIIEPLDLRKRFREMLDKIGKNYIDKN